MEYVNILTLRPLPAPERICPTCKLTFTSRLKMNAESYVTCEGCSHKIRQQGQKHRDYIKKIRLYNNKQLYKY